MNLEAELKRIDQDHELWTRLQKVKNVAKEIWKHPELSWYTEHDTKHSKRIVTMIGDILNPLYQEHSQGKLQLSAHELYILLTACYLHDIGMQDLDIGITRDKLTPEHFTLIRDRHPDCSYRLIIDRTIKPGGRDEYHLPLKDDNDLRLIAHVARAHGTEFFEDSCQVLQKLAPWDRKRDDKDRVRGELLAALLMIGDELDLFSDRARYPENCPFPPEALLHNYKHHYIYDVRVQDGGIPPIPHIRQIFIQFQCPGGSKEDLHYQTIKEWVVNKLKEQCDKTKSIFSKHLELQWDPDIRHDIYEDCDDYVRPIPSEVLPLLEKIYHELQKTTNVTKVEREAKIWLENNIESFINQAVHDVLKEYNYLGKPYEALDSKEKIEHLRDFIDEHLFQIHKCLKYPTRLPDLGENLQNTPRLTNKIYKKAFESIKEQINRAKNQKKNNVLSYPEDKEIQLLLSFIDILLKRYS